MSNIEKFVDDVKKAERPEDALTPSERALACELMGNSAEYLKHFFDRPTQALMAIEGAKASRPDRQRW